MCLFFYKGDHMKKTLSLIIKICMSMLFIQCLLTKDVFAYSLTNNDTKYIIFIDVNDLSLSVMDKTNYKIIKTYPVAMGKKSTPSPIGTFQVTSKALKKERAFGGYWLGLNAPWDTFGIHGTSNPGSIGSLASNGCIRMYTYNIKELYSMIDYGTSVVIGPDWFWTPYVRSATPLQRGTDIYHTQRILKALGYYTGPVNGIYEPSLISAVMTYKDEHSMPVDSKIDPEFLKSLGLCKFE